MHELGICRNIVAIVSEAAKGRPVTRVTLEIGQLSGVVPDALRFAFEAVTLDTVLQGAVLEVIGIPGRAQCADCGANFALTALHAACICGSHRLTRLAGQELNIKTMETADTAFQRIA
jgi:hydrogenase nickel incorporation protein HypA/HybF